MGMMRIVHFDIQLYIHLLTERQHRFKVLRRDECCVFVIGNPLFA